MLQGQSATKLRAFMCLYKGRAASASGVESKNLLCTASCYLLYTTHLKSRAVFVADTPGTSTGKEGHEQQKLSARVTKK